jgi:hypothetical protein
VYGRPPVLSRPLIFATAFMSFFSVVIALFKVNGVYLFISNFSNNRGVEADNFGVSCLSINMFL